MRTLLRHVRKADFARMAAIDVDNIEIQFIAPVRQPRQNLARIAGEEMHPSRKFAFEEVDAFDRVAVGQDIDPVIFEPGVRREGEQSAVPGVHPDLEQPLLEPHCAPEVSAGRSEIVGWRIFRKSFIQVRIEDVAFEALAALPDDRVDPPEPPKEDVGKDFDERVAMNGVVWNFRRGHRLARNHLAAVHDCRPPRSRVRAAGLRHMSADEHLLAGRRAALHAGLSAS